MAALIGRTCNGTICTLGWVISVCAILMCPLTTWLFAICWFDFRAYRARGNKHPEELEISELPKYESAGTTDRSQNHSPDPRDPRQPMVHAGHDYDGHYQHPHQHQHQHQHRYHESTEYHSGYAKTPTQIV